MDGVKGRRKLREVGDKPVSLMGREVVEGEGAEVRKVDLEVG